MLRLQNRRVLLFTEEYPPEIGGIQSYLSQLWEKLPSNFSFVVAKQQKEDGEWDREQKYKIVRTKTRGLTFPRWRPAYIALTKAIKSFQPEVLVCGKALFEGRAALKAKRKFGIPYVVITHAMEINTWLNNWKTKRDLLAVLNNAERILVVNQKIKELLLGVGIPEKKFVKMYPGVDDFFAEGSVAVKKSNGKTIITVCRLVSRKGIDIVIRSLPQVLKNVPDLSYVIAGDGPELENLKRIAREVGVENIVRFVGKVSREKMRELLHSADLFVMVPKNQQGNMEGFGIVYLEAAAAGLCSVGSNSGGVPEAVLDKETGLLAKEGDTEDTASKISTLLLDPELRNQLAQKAHERAIREFVWSKRAQLFRGVVESVVLEKENK